jgi:hypothetical protein
MKIPRVILFTAFAIVLPTTWTVANAGSANCPGCVVHVVADRFSERGVRVQTLSVRRVRSSGRAAPQTSGRKPPGVCRHRRT